jgi:hypothetical protein
MDFGSIMRSVSRSSEKKQYLRSKARAVAGINNGVEKPGQHLMRRHNINYRDALEQS